MKAPLILSAKKGPFPFEITTIFPPTQKTAEMVMIVWQRSSPVFLCHCCNVYFTILILFFVTDDGCSDATSIASRTNLLKTHFPKVLVVFDGSA